MLYAVIETVKGMNNRVDLMFMMLRCMYFLTYESVLKRLHGNANAPFATNIISHNRVLRLGHYFERDFCTSILERYHPALSIPRLEKDQWWYLYVHI